MERPSALSSPPGLLVSFVYLEEFLKRQRTLQYQDWVLDSGAFSAHASGKAIDLVQYIETCHRLKSEDPTLTEVFALDVIGDWKASLKNCETMWAAGIEAIPCFHYGSPEDALLHIAREYPKIAIGGVARATMGKKLSFARQVFARVWPKKIHGFGFGTKASVLALPFHSVDATNWELGPCGFGVWRTFGQMSVRGSMQNLRCEVEFYLKLQETARRRWKKEMKMIEGDDPPLAVRLALSGWTEGRTKVLLKGEK